MAFEEVIMVVYMNSILPDTENPLLGLPLSAILVRRFTMAMSAMLISLHQVVLRNTLNQCLLQPSFSSDANLDVLHIIYQVAILLIW